MTASHVKDVPGVDSKGPWLAADGWNYPLFSRSCGPDVAQVCNFEFILKSGLTLTRIHASHTMSLERAPQIQSLDLNFYPVGLLCAFPHPASQFCMVFGA